MTTLNNFLRLFVFGIFISSIIFCKQKPEALPEKTVVQDTLVSEPAHHSDRDVHWGYDTEHGPAVWATLSPTYALCSEGKNQSPINLTSTSGIKGEKWKLNYKKTSIKISHNQYMPDILDNGHTIQVNVDEGSTLTFGDKIYNLKQFHFHAPSEHTLNGKNMPLEIHMVHQSDDGSLAVLGLLFEEGTTPNENLAKIIANLPGAKGESTHVTDQFLDLNLHVPKEDHAYHYVGSLTTPPCTENVQWIVLREIFSATADQIKALSDRISPNNRPTQPLNDRLVEEIKLAERK